jgi:hypothetical protein
LKHFSRAEFLDVDVWNSTDIVHRCKFFIGLILDAMEAGSGKTAKAENLWWAKRALAWWCHHDSRGFTDWRKLGR